MTYNQASNLRLALTVGLFFFGLVLISNSSRILGDPDTYWHIGAGRWMIEHLAVPTVDPFSSSITGTAWVAHEWLAEIIFAAIYQWFGWGGLLFLTALLVGASLAAFSYLIGRWLEPLHTMLIVALGFLTLAPHLLVRPHMVAMPLMITFVGGLVIARERKDRPSFWLLPVICIWANLHGAFSLGLGFAVYFAVEALLHDGWRQGSQWLLFVGCAFGSVLLSPNGINGVLILGTYISDIQFMTSVIQEWQSPDFHFFQPLEVWLLGFLFLSLSCGFRVPLMRLLILVGLVHLALKYARNGELVGFLAPLVVLSSIAPQFYDAMRRGYGNLSSQAPWLFALVRPDDKQVTVSSRIVLIALALLILPLTRFFMMDHDRKDGSSSPMTAVAAARAAGVSGPVFNSYQFGGYLIFAGIPPFIDGRGELYGDKFVERYVKAEGLAEGLTDLLSQYQSGWALLRPDAVANLKFADLPDWRKLYADDFAVVYVHKGILVSQ